MISLYLYFFSLTFVVPCLPISFPEHARSRVSGGHSSGETIDIGDIDC